MKSLFEQLGGTYREENGYLIPNLTLPDEEQVDTTSHALDITTNKRYTNIKCMLVTGGRAP